MSDEIELKGYENQAWRCPSCGHRIAGEEVRGDATHLRCVECDEHMERVSAKTNRGEAE